MTNFLDKLKAFLHDPIDKCFDIPKHIEKAKNYAKVIGVNDVDKIKGPDHIASCMERSLLPSGVTQKFNELRHPLSEGLVKVVDYINVTDVFQDIEDIYKNKIASKISGWDDKKKFIYLWRNLQDLIFDGVNEKDWVKYLPVLPADTRVPDHSIWEHLKIASAINAYWDEENKELIQNNSLFLFTIGPVQSFVAQARKTQDFYMGSYILSFLTFKAMEIIIDNYGPTNIIYPDPYKQSLVDWWIKKNLYFKPTNFDETSIQLPTIPNRFVAIMPLSENERIEELANKMRGVVRNQVNEIKDRILKKSKVDLIDDIKQKIDSQISEFPDIYWVALPWKLNGKDINLNDLKVYFDDEIIENYERLWNFALKKGEHNPNVGLLYEILYCSLEKSIGARKNLRRFFQLNCEEKGRKCSVCGERDVVFFREKLNKGKFTKYNKYVVDLTDNTRLPLKFLAEGEGLCTICFIKRTSGLYLEDEVSDLFKDLSFPSTAEIACADFKERVLKYGSQEINNYQEKIERFSISQNVQPLPRIRTLFDIKNNIEGAWFYEENLRDRYIKEVTGRSLTQEQIDELKNDLRKITDKVGNPNPYYAIIHFDGDYMGKWLSGELLPNIVYSYNSETYDKLPEDFKTELNNIRNNKLLTPAIHASISTALRNYSLEFVRKIVEEEHLGKIVYAGGDDVLAFVNLRDLFDVMQKLRWAFSGQVKIESGQIAIDLKNTTGFVEKYGRVLLTMGVNATASMGVVIAHYKMPLQIVIKKVFEMEKEAKKERNSFAICFMRRSGEERIAKAKWIYIGEETIEVLDILRDLSKAFDEENPKGHIAMGFIQKLASSFARLKENRRFSATADIFNIELLRLLTRSFNSPKGYIISEREKKEFINEISEKMKEFFWKTGGDIDNFLNFCILSTFIFEKGRK